MRVIDRMDFVGYLSARQIDWMEIVDIKQIARV